MRKALVVAGLNLFRDLLALKHAGPGGGTRHTVRVVWTGLGFERLAHAGILRRRTALLGSPCPRSVQPRRAGGRGRAPRVRSAAPSRWARARAERQVSRARTSAPRCSYIAPPRTSPRHSTSPPPMTPIASTAQ